MAPAPCQRAGPNLPPAAVKPPDNFFRKEKKGQCAQLILCAAVADKAGACRCLMDRLADVPECLFCSGPRAARHAKCTSGTGMITPVADLHPTTSLREATTVRSKVFCRHILLAPMCVAWESVFVSHRAVRYGPVDRAKLLRPTALRPEPCPRTRMRYGGLPSTSTMAPGME